MKVFSRLTQEGRFYAMERKMDQNALCLQLICVYQLSNHIDLIVQELP